MQNISLHQGQIHMHEKEQPVEVPVALDFCVNLSVCYYSTSEKPCRKSNEQTFTNKSSNAHALW